MQHGRCIISYCKHYCCGWGCRNYRHTISRAKILRDAPDELLALHNEVSDLTITFRSIENVISTQDLGGSTLPRDLLHHTSTLIDRARQRLLKVDHPINHRLLKSGSLDGDYKVFWIRWMRVRNEMEGHRAALRDIRQNLILQVLMINS